MIKAELIDFLGSDLTVVNAARVSFDKESDVGDYVSSGISKADKGLIKYLAKHNHWTPFSHPQITMRYTVPIFVARQEFKHIVGFTRNEVSRRYVNDDPEFYIPREWRMAPEGSVKQGSGDIIEGPQAGRLSIFYDKLLAEAELNYTRLLHQGVAPEMARMVLPQSMMTSYYVTGSLAAYARMVKQRLDPHAQVEIQELAKMVAEVIKPLYPICWEALTNE